MNNDEYVQLANEMAEQARKHLEHRMAVDIYSDGVCVEPDCPWHPDEEDRSAEAHAYDLDIR